MSVQVKTPTRAQFEHVEFQCGEKTPPGNVESFVRGSGDISDRSSSSHGNKGNPVNQPRAIGRKRRSSERGGSGIERGERSGNFGGSHLGGKKRPRFGHGRGRERIILPSKFLLGGNINDPLNLNSLNDANVDAALNSSTPHTSPLPLPSHRNEVKVMLPPNISDPLNLTSTDDGPVPVSAGAKAKRKRHKKKRRSTGEGANSNEANKDITKPLHVDVQSKDKKSPTEELTNDPMGQKLKHIVDKIVSPVIPQSSPKGQRRKQTHSESDSSRPDASSSSKGTKPDREKTSPKIRFSRQGSNQKTTDKADPKPKGDSQSKCQKRFIYGNYNRYYGYRNAQFECDHRLNCFRADWFEGKDVLDIGCNVGHMTLEIAKDFKPKKIVGIDIDGSLIAAARKNIRHYISSVATATGGKKFPSCMSSLYGPVSGSTQVGAPQKPEFPNNVAFVQGNYVLDNDVLLDLQVEEYDAILCLSITKWIHLNWGDEGLKRTFKRIYRQLRKGGRLILEPQGWTSYKKKKNLTEAISSNFKSIKFKPDQFTEYLLSKEVGFSTCELVDVPFNKNKGFQRPIQVFIKGTDSLPGTAQNTPDPSYTTPGHVGHTPGHTGHIAVMEQHLYCPVPYAGTPEMGSPVVDFE